MPKKSASSSIQSHAVTIMHQQIRTLGLPSEGIAHERVYNEDIEYAQRAFDALARMMEVETPCCALYPEFNENDDGTKTIVKLHVSFNKSISPTKQAKLIDIFQTIQHTLASDMMEPEEQIDSIVTAVMLNSAHYDKAGWFPPSKTLNLIDYHLLNAQKQFATELSALNEELSNAKMLAEKIECLRTSGEPNNDLEIELYYNSMTLLSNFLEDRLIQEYLSTAPEAEQSRFFNSIFYPYRLYADCKKIVELFPEHYDIAAGDDVLEILPNPDSAHAELVILKKFDLKPEHHVGISKLCCAQCYAIFNFFQEKGYIAEDLDVVLGSHGFANLTKFKPGPLTEDLDPLLIRGFITTLVNAAPHTPQAPTLVEQNSELSDDESVDGFDSSDTRLVSVRSLAHIWGSKTDGDSEEEYYDSEEEEGGASDKEAGASSTTIAVTTEASATEDTAKATSPKMKLHPEILACVISKLPTDQQKVAAEIVGIDVANINALVDNMNTRMKTQFTPDEAIQAKAGIDFDSVNSNMVQLSGVNLDDCEMICLPG